MGILVLLLVLVVVVMVSLVVGPASLDVMEVAIGIVNPASLGDLKQTIVWEIRLPRMLIGVVVGAALATTGGAIQGLFRNPLADPALIGVSSGAALAASAFIVFAADVVKVSPYLSLPICAFIGGLLSTWLVLKVGGRNSAISTMLLAGIAINAVAIAGVGFFSYVSSESELRSVMFWALGSLNGADWDGVKVGSLALLAVMLLQREAKGLNAIVLGESEARHLGVSVDALKRRVVSYTAVAVGIAVSLVGVIAFVGLIVPHLVRLTIGSNHKLLLPASAIAGSILVLAADSVARVVLAPAELPIGIITALVGGPFFIFLILKYKRRLGIEG